VAEAAAGRVLDWQSAAPRGLLAEKLEQAADFHFVVQNATGIVSVPVGITVTEALIRLRAYAFSHDRPVGDVARDVVARTLRLE
jgi:AmiR/NasT family two-component response regulator